MSSSGLSGALGKNESLESCGFFCEDPLIKVEPTFVISMMAYHLLAGVTSMRFIQCS